VCRGRSIIVRMCYGGEVLAGECRGSVSGERARR
jgi:hypothetical protein